VKFHHLLALVLIQTLHIWWKYRNTINLCFRISQSLFRLLILDKLNGWDIESCFLGVVFEVIIFQRSRAVHQVKSVNLKASSPAETDTNTVIIPKYAKPQPLESAVAGKMQMSHLDDSLCDIVHVHITLRLLS
jgi:hypothetical protein